MYSGKTRIPRGIAENTQTLTRAESFGARARARRPKLWAAILLFAVTVGLAAFGLFGGKDNRVGAAGGTGSEADPYLISTEAELKGLKNYLGANGAGKFFKLTNDIMLTGQWQGLFPDSYSNPREDTSAQWSATVFRGTFDGDGYAIRNLYGYGLFTGTSGATIKNLTVEIGANGVTEDRSRYNGSNSEFREFGGIVERMSGGLMENCHVYGGGLTSTGKGSNDSGYVGGLIGKLSGEGLLSKSSSRSNINIGGNTACAGGLIGHIDGSGSVENCFATGNITATGSSYASGLIGGWSGPGNAWLGNAGSSHYMKNCFYSGVISAADWGRAGPLVGYRTSGSTLTNNLYETGRNAAFHNDNCRQYGVASGDQAGGSITRYVGRTADEMKAPATWTTSNSSSGPFSGAAFNPNFNTGVWRLETKRLPALRGNPATYFAPSVQFRNAAGAVTVPGTTDGVAGSWTNISGEGYNAIGASVSATFTLNTGYAIEDIKFSGRLSSGALVTDYSLKSNPAAAVPQGNGTDITYASWTGGANPRTLSFLNTAGEHSFVVETRQSKYSVTFDRNDPVSNPPNAIVSSPPTGNNPAQMDFVYGTAQAMPASPYTSETHAFRGWARSSAAAAPDYQAGQNVSNLTDADGETIPLYAVWERTGEIVSITSGVGGGSSPAGRQLTTPPGANLAISITENPGYELTGITVNGASVGAAELNAAKASKTFTLSNLRSDYTVEFAFTPIMYTIDYSGLTDIPGLNNPNASRTGFTLNDLPFALAPATSTAYTFGGWRYDGRTAGTFTVDKVAANYRNIVFETLWTPVAFPITYTLNDGGDVTTNNAANRASYTYESPDFTVQNPTRAGYTFDGWTPGGGYGVGIPQGSIGARSYIAAWTATLYTVTYNLNDGGDVTTDNSANPGGYTVESPSFTLKPPTRTGYTFTGWQGSPTTFPAAPYGHLSFTAQWRANTYTVAFDGNGNTGGATASVPMTYGVSKQLTANGFIRDGYTFDQWTANGDGSGDNYANNAAVDKLTDVDGGIVILYAQWTQNDYKLVFDKNGADTGAALPEKTLEYSEDYQLPDPTAAPYLWSRTGYRFAGWSHTANGTADYAAGGTVSKLSAGGSVTLHACWTANTYTIAFAGGDSSAQGNMPPVPATYGIPLQLPGVLFTRAGYSFGSWSDGTYNYADTASVLNLTDADGGTVTLTAVWVPRSYTVEYDLNGGAVTGGTIPSQTAGIDEEIPLRPQVPTRVGYTFTGWRTSPTDTAAALYQPGDAVKNLGVPGSVVRVFAIWAAITYTVTFDVKSPTGNSGDVTPQPGADTHTYDADRALPSLDAGNAYTFLGWSKNSAATQADYLGTARNLSAVQGDTVQLYAVWILNTTPGAYYLPNGAPGGSHFEAWLTDAEPLAADIFSWTGYKFLGWDENQGGSGAPLQPGDFYTKTGVTATFYAIWEAITYTITYNNNGGTSVPAQIPPTSATYDVPAALESAVPALDGYEFKGWQLPGGGIAAPGAQVLNLTATANDTVELLAVFAARSFTVSYGLAGGAFPGANTNPASLTYDASYGLSYSPVRTGYKFDGWSVSASGASFPQAGTFTGAAYLAHVTGANEIHLIAKWIAETVQALFMPGIGGAGMLPNQTFTYGQTAALQENKDYGAPYAKVVRTGYAFSGWSTALNGGVGADVFGFADREPVSGSFLYETVANYANFVVLYAQWTPNTYNVTLDYNGSGQQGEIRAVLYGNPTPLPSPLRTDHSFVRWDTKNDGTGLPYAAGASYTVWDNATLYAIWAYNYDTSGLVYTIDAGNTNTPDAGWTWTRGDIVFTFANLDPSRPLVFEMKRGSGNWEPIAVSSNLVYTFTESYNGTLSFRASLSFAPAEYYYPNGTAGNIYGNAADGVFTVKSDRVSPDITLGALPSPTDYKTAPTYNVGFTLKDFLSKYDPKARIDVFYGNSAIPVRTMFAIETSLAVDKNGEYRLTAYNAAGVSSTTTFTVAFMDNAAIDTTVAADQTTGQNVWLSSGVTFTVYPNLDPSAGGSGLLYTYSTDNWQTSTPVPYGAVGYRVTLNPIGGFLVEHIRFRAERVSNAADYKELQDFYVNIDTVTPAISARDITTYQTAKAYGNERWLPAGSSVAVELTVTGGYSTRFGNIILQRYDPLALTWTALNGLTPAIAGTGPWTLTYLTQIDRNGVYRFSAASLAGLRDESSPFTVDTIDTAPATAFGVTPINDGRWTTQTVSFNLSINGRPLSGAYPMFREQEWTGAAWDSWSPWSSPMASTTQIYPGNADVHKRVEFGWASGRDLTDIHTDAAWVFEVMISNKEPTVAAVNLAAGGGVVTGSVPIELTINFFGDGTGRFEVLYPGTGTASWVYDSSAVLAPQGNGVYKYTFYAPFNGTYAFRVFSASGVAGAREASEAVAEIEDETIVPQFTVTENNVAGWTTADARFKLDLLQWPTSLAFFQYRLIADNGTIGAWTDITDPTGTGFRDSAEFTIGYSFHGTVWFRTVTGTGNEYDPQVPYSVQIDKVPPTIGVTGNPTAWQNTEAVLNVAIGGGASGVTWSVRKDSDAPSAWTADTTFTTTGNGFYVFTVRNGATVTDEATAKVEYIDVTTPVLTVSASNAGDWTGSDVSFTLAVTNTVPAGVTYEYSTNGGNRWNPVSGNVLTRTGNENATYVFRAVSGSIVYSAISTPYDVKIDKVPPTVGVTGNPTAWQNTEAVLNVAIGGGASGVTWSVRKDGGAPSAWTADSTFTTTGNGSYVFTVRNGATVTDEVTAKVDYIDAVSPVFSVSAPQASTDGSKWSSMPVTFGFIQTQTPLSGARYEVSRDGSTGWTAIDPANVNASAVTYNAETDNGAYYFRAISGAGSVYNLPTVWYVKMDIDPPAIEMYEPLPEKLTNKDIVALIKATWPGSGGSLLPMAGTNGADLSLNVELTAAAGGAYEVYNFILRENGSYNFRAQANNGQIRDLNVATDRIDKTVPVIKGTVLDADYVNNDFNGRAFQADAVVFIENYDGYTVTVTDKDGQEIDMQFVNGAAAFKKNGSYTITAFDEAGNSMTVSFTIDKPDYAMITVGSVIGLTLVGALIFLAYVSIRNRMALRRLIAESTSSDDPNKFLLFKKIK